MTFRNRFVKYDGLQAAAPRSARAAWIDTTWSAAADHANAQDLADRLNASGIDWNYSDDHRLFEHGDLGLDGSAD